MFAEVLLVSSLAALPLSPLPMDRHAEMLARIVAADIVPTMDPIELAQATPAGPGGPPPGAGMRDGGPDGRGMPGMGFMHHGLNLTEAQQDAIFNLFHAQAPQMREQMKALRKSRAALRELSRAETLDEQRAAQIANDIARTTAAIELMRARTHAAIWKLLTPEQRQQAAKMPFAPMHLGPMGHMGGEGFGAGLAR